jgi:hypothetical protein
VCVGISPVQRDEAENAGALDQHRYNIAWREKRAAILCIYRFEAYWVEGDRHPASLICSTALRCGDQHPAASLKEIMAVTPPPPKLSLYGEPSVRAATGFPIEGGICFEASGAGLAPLGFRGVF